MTPAEAEETYDYIVCTHKAINQASATKQLAPAMDEKKTTIVIIQNGVGNEDPFREAFPNNVILSCVVCEAVSGHLLELTHHRPGSVPAKIHLASSTTGSRRTLR